MVELGLKPAILSELSPEVAERLGKLSNWDLKWTRRRLQTRLGWSRGRALKIEQEYRRFLALIVLNPDKIYGMAGPVDEFWHEHLLDTQDYLKFCERIAGRIIHHQPEQIAMNRRTRPRAANTYSCNTLPDLTAHFVETNTRIWPHLAFGKCGKCRDVAQVYQVAAQSVS
jgi:hypothetical protein